MTANRTALLAMAEHHAAAYQAERDAMFTELDKWSAP
jgi:hypothetical protein